MNECEKEILITYLAHFPEAGISLGGGLRKVRTPKMGQSKSGGYRVVYIFGGKNMPLFLVTVFAKNEKSNLREAEQAAAVKMSKQIIAQYGENS